MSEKMIEVARFRNTPYTVNYTTNGGMKTYQWTGSKGEKIDSKPIPQEVVDWLVMNSRCFTEAELVIVDKSEEAQEIIDNIDDKELLESNSHSFDEVKKLLEGNFPKMKKELEQVTLDEEKRFIIDVAKEIKLDSASKRDFLSQWLGIPVDILFSVE